MEEMRNASGRPRHTWEDNIEMDLWEIGWEVVDSMNLRIGTGGGAGGRPRKHGNEPSGSIKGEKFLD
jgi:hypothetical protein